MVIDSTPPPIAASTPSLITMCAAWTIAWRPELQKRLTVRPAVVTGSPARSAATRATLWPCGPCGWPQPRMTSSISRGLDCRRLAKRVGDAVRGEVVGPRHVERSAMGLGERRAAARHNDGFSHRSWSDSTGEYNSALRHVRFSHYRRRRAGRPVRRRSAEAVSRDRRPIDPRNERRRAGRQRRDPRDRRRASGGAPRRRWRRRAPVIASRSHSSPAAPAGRIRWRTRSRSRHAMPT